MFFTEAINSHPINSTRIKPHPNHFQPKSISTRSISTRINSSLNQFPPGLTPTRSISTRINYHPISFVCHLYTASFFHGEYFCIVSVLHRCHFSTNYYVFLTALYTKRSVSMASISYCFTNKIFLY